MGLNMSIMDDLKLLKVKEKSIDKEIFSKHQNGSTINELSEMYGISPRYVQFKLKNQKLLKDWGDELEKRYNRIMDKINKGEAITIKSDDILKCENVNEQQFKIVLNNGTEYVMNGWVHGDGYSITME